MDSTHLSERRKLRNLPVEWPDSCYERFNFQQASQLQELVDLALDDTSPSVVVLAGEPGIGRGFFCQAAQFLADQQGRPIGLWDLDLRGFEPDSPNALTAFLKQLNNKQERERAAFRENAKENATGAIISTAEAISLTGVAETELVGAGGDWAACLFSLLWQFEIPFEHISEISSRSEADGEIPSRRVPAMLRACLAELSKDQKLLIHGRDWSSLPVTLRRWLVREAEKAPERLLLVISSSLEADKAEVTPASRHEPARIEIHSLSHADLRRALDERFAPNLFPDDLVTSLMEGTGGRPGAIAHRLADLMEVGAIAKDTNACWRLPPDGHANPRVAEVLSAGFFERVADHLAEEDDQEQKVLRDFLVLAALGGNFVPLPPIFAFLGLGEEGREAVTDFVDDVLEGELGWLTDCGFQHPSFPGINVYAFTNNLIPHVILDQISEIDREVQAIKFLRFLEEAAQPRRRGMTRWLLAIADHLGPKERNSYEHQLAWWCGQEDVEPLREEIETRLQAEELEPEAVWRIAREANTWPPYRRLALHDALTGAAAGEGKSEQDVVSPEDLPLFHALRADLLRLQGRFAEALDAALEMRSWVEDHSFDLGQALSLSGLARLKLGQPQLARVDLEQALDIFTPSLGPEHPATVSAQITLAHTAYTLNDYERARDLFQIALSAAERTLGAEHPYTLNAKVDLATTLRALGKSEPAQKLEEEVLDARRRVLGPEHPDILAMQSALEKIRPESG